MATKQDLIEMVRALKVSLTESHQEEIDALHFGADEDKCVHCIEIERAETLLAEADKETKKASEKITVELNKKDALDVGLALCNAAERRDYYTRQQSSKLRKLGKKLLNFSE